MGRELVSCEQGAPILVVDDKERNRYSFQAILADAGFEVEVANSGMEALRYLMSSPASLVLLDVQMPEINGFETARMIRQNNRYSDLPIIFISATQNTEEFIRHGYSVGAYEYLTKPVDNQILINKVKVFHSLYCQHKKLQAHSRAVEERNAAVEALNRSLQNNEALQQALERAGCAVRAKDEFLASMSHELRTPLTALLGNGELLSQTALNPQQRELLESMSISGKSLLYLINDILDSSKISAGKFEIGSAEFDLSVLLGELRQLFQRRAEEAGLQFTIEQQLDERLLCVGDGQRLTQILVNLLGNAIKFTEQGGVTLRVTEDLQTAKIRFVVEDSGIGMDQEVIERLFQPFEQADSSISSRYGGTGLGLYISSSLTRLMQGELSAESKPGQGSRFYLTLPLQVVTRPSAPSPPTAASNKGASVRLQGTVLIVEDAPELQLLVRRMVEPLGPVVELAGNGVEALERATATPYDLILMDMQMPLMDGIEATRRLRGSGYHQPIVALTANVMEQYRKEFTEAGCDQFLSKPIDRAALMAVLQRYLAEG